MGQLLGANFALQGRPCPFKAVTVLRDEEEKMDSDNSWSCSSSFIYCVQGQRKEAAGSPVPALARMTSAPRLGRKIVALFQKQGLPVNWDEKGATAPAARHPA